jgi:hypothetical protein
MNNADIKQDAKETVQKLNQYLTNEFNETVRRERCTKYRYQY